MKTSHQGQTSHSETSQSGAGRGVRPTVLGLETRVMDMLMKQGRGRRSYPGTGELIHRVSPPPVMSHTLTLGTREDCNWPANAAIFQLGFHY